MINKTKRRYSFTLKTVIEMSKLDLSGPVRVPLGMKFRFDYQNEGALYGSLPRTSKEYFEYAILY